MKKYIKKIFAAFAAVALTVGLAFSPIIAGAETVIPETTVTEEFTEELPNESTENPVETPLPSATEETPEENETPKNPTFEDFLAAVQKEAERYGYGDEYAKAIENLKTAATTKQVTLSTILSAAVALGVLTYIVYSKVKDKTLKKEVHELYKLLQGQNDGTNALIDGANETEKTVRETNETTSEAKKELDDVQTAISCFISAFLAFSDGHKYNDAKKSEVERNCAKALKVIDKGSVTNENNAK